MEPIYKTSNLGFKIELFRDKLVYRPFLQWKQTIFLNQIASVRSGITGDESIKIETTGGKVHTLYPKWGEIERLCEAITKAAANMDKV